MIIGHQRILNFFDSVIAHHNLSHAYCFVGPEQVGKRTVAEHLSARLLKIEKDKLATHPDFIIVRQEVDAKTGKTKKNIDVEQIRTLRALLAQSSFLGSYKVAIIDGAEKLNHHSANALLKTLEEPKAKRVLFLITKDETQLPETIRSRCQTLYFQPVAKAEMARALAAVGNGKPEIGNRGRDTGKMETVARLATGLPGRALRWLNEPELYEEYKKEVRRWPSLRDRPFYEKIKAVEDLFGDQSDYIIAQERLQSVLDLWLLVLRDELCARFDRGCDCVHEVIDGGRMGAGEVLHLCRLIRESKALINQNVQPRLLVENILLELGKF